MKRIISLLIASLLVLSCNKDCDLPISVSPSTTLFVSSNGGFQTYYVNCSDDKCPWHITVTDESWMSLSKNSSHGNGNFTVDVRKNSSTDNRFGQIYIKTLVGYDYKTMITIDVVQYGNVSSEGGGNTGGGNTGGGNTGGGNTGGGNTGGGNTETIPSAPTNVLCQNVGNDYLPQIKITWDAVSNATSYNVYRSRSSSGNYILLGSNTYANYTDWEPMNGNNYYKVKAVNGAGESSFSSYTMFNYDPSSALKPAPPTVSVSGSSTIYLTWTCTTSDGFGKANKYEVYKRDPNTADFYLLTTTTSTNYSDRDSHPGINYYAVKAINDAGASDPGFGKSSSITLPKPSSFSAHKSGSDVVFSWSKVSDATGYQIFESSSAHGTYTILDNIVGGSTTTETRYYPASGVTKYFKIKAVWETKYGGIVYSDFTSYKAVKF